MVERLKDVYKIWQEILPNISKNHRQTIGNKIDALLIETLESAFQATYASQNRKHNLVSNALVNCDSVKFFLLVAWECKVIKDNQYLRISKILIEINKMLLGWKNHLEKKTSALM